MGKNGGKRPGAGRKPKAVTENKRTWATAILPDDEEREHWRDLIANPKTRLDALRYITDHKRGKAPQSMTVSGDENKPIQLVVKVIGGNSSSAETG